MCTNFKKKKHFCRYHKGLRREMAQKVEKKWLVALGKLYFIDERQVLEKMFQREVINEELSMPFNASLSLQRQI